MDERLDLRRLDPQSVLALPAGELRGDRMVLATRDGAVEVQAPEPWLERLSEGGDKGLTLGQVLQFGDSQPDQQSFEEFLSDLLAGGLASLHPAGSARPRIDFFEDSVGSLRAIARAELRWDDQSRSEGWGRGTSRTIAAGRALGEAVERHAFKSGAPTVVARGRDILDAEPQRSFVAHTRAQYLEHDFPLKVYSELDDRPWLKTECLATGQARWIPAEAILSSGALAAKYRAQRCALATSSGFACAPSLDDAREHATWELIERDAFMRHWLAQRGGREIRLDTLPAHARASIGQMQAVGCSVQVQRLTLGSAPVWLAFVQHGQLGFTCTGAAAGRDAAFAVERAVDEAHGQALARVSTAEYSTPEGVAPESVSTPGDHARLYAMPEYFLRANALLRCDGSETFAQSEASLGKRMSASQVLERAGAKASVIDFSPTSPAFDETGRRLHTVRVVVPDLMPMTFGARLLPLAFGRAQMGAWFPHPFA